MPDPLLEKTLLEVNQVGSAIQWFGTLFVAILMLLLRRSVERKFLDYWAAGWCFWAVSLLAINGSFNIPAARPILWTIYSLCGCAFGVFVVAGCVKLRTDQNLIVNWSWFWIPGIVVIGVCVGNLSTEINVMYAAQALILMVFFSACVVALHRGSKPYPFEAGDRVLNIVLVLLALDYLVSSAICGYAGLTGRQFQFSFMKYAPLYDFFLAIFLALGMIMVVMESVRRELVAINADLTRASERLQNLAEVDPLTQALNRHAFYSLIEKHRKEQSSNLVGCVALFDLDNLKPINDTYGHPVGDAAIRAAAKAIRSAIRADDLVFRWGGDEFLVVLSGISAEESARRFEKINAQLLNQKLTGVAKSLDLSVSFGVATLNGTDSLEEAIAAADSAMYKQKQAQPNRRFPRILQA